MTSFTAAVTEVKNCLITHGTKVVVEFKTLLDVRVDGWDFDKVIDWMLASHIHFLLTHPHQGLEHFGWSVVAIYEEVKRLTYHPGFPSLKKIGCPIFRQDKWDYLQHLNAKEMTAPSIKIPLEEQEEVQVAAGLESFSLQFPTIAASITT